MWIFKFSMYCVLFVWFVILCCVAFLTAWLSRRQFSIMWTIQFRTWPHCARLSLSHSSRPLISYRAFLSAIHHDALECSLPFQPPDLSNPLTHLVPVSPVFHAEDSHSFHPVCVFSLCCIFFSVMHMCCQTGNNVLSVCLYFFYLHVFFFYPVLLY